MPNVQYPGVYVEEVPSGPRPIGGVSTSTAGFIGVAAGGPIGQAIPITSLVDFEREFAGLDTRLELGYAVMQFFNNGGQRAWVVRVSDRDGVREGLAALGSLDPVVNLVCLPGWVEEEVVADAVAHCDLHRAFLIADPPGSDLEAAITHAAMVGQSRSANAAVYFPPVVVADPTNGGAPRSCAPSGTVAGILARTDTERGVFASPGDAAVVGVTRLEVDLTEADATRLNEAGVSSLRSFPTRGIRVWGSRTVASSSSEWRYVPVRRVALFIEESLYRGLQWAVFEPNDQPMWIQVQQSVRNFMSDLWRSGGLRGSVEQEAYFVKRSRIAMRGDDLDKGRLDVLVGFAPVKPSEFVILRVTIQTSDKHP